MRPATVIAALAGLLLGACTNGFGSFEFGDAGASSGGSSGSGGSAGGTGATGGSAGGGMAGTSGTGGGSSCLPGQQLCDGACVALDDRRNCGGCGNDCRQQGFGSGFICDNGACVCGLSDRCGDTSAVCLSSAGPCECAGTACQPGEACVDDGSVRCGCNDGAACADGETCCQTPDGCFDLTTDDANCGRCGNACSGGTSCTSGECR